MVPCRRLSTAAFSGTGPHADRLKKPSNRRTPAMMNLPHGVDAVRAIHDVDGLVSSMLYTQSLEHLMEHGLRKIQLKELRSDGGHLA